MKKTDDNVRNLHPRIVNVVLHLDVLSTEPQQAHKRIAQNGVAQMADVRGLIGIDAGMLDENLAGLRVPAGADGVRSSAMVSVKPSGVWPPDSVSLKVTRRAAACPRCR